MRLLFEIDTKDYKPDGVEYVRPSVRAIVINGSEIEMVYSKKYDYYKFPGGGIERGEDHADALLREAVEEAGLILARDSIREYGYVHRVQKTDAFGADVFVQDNYYYFAKAKGRTGQSLDGYEREEGFISVSVDPAIAIAVNRHGDHGPKDMNMIGREATVLEMLIAEGSFNNKE